MDDFAKRLARLVLEGDGQTASSDELRKAELKIRQHFGGERVYIRRPRSLGKIDSLANALASGGSLAEAFASAGCSRQWGYKLLSKPWRCW